MPQPLSNVELLPKLWLDVGGGRDFSRDHPTLASFELALRERRAQEMDPVSSYENIILPYPVETDIIETPLHWSEDGVAIVYVDLKAAQSSYASVRKRQRFIDMSARPAAAVTYTPVTPPSGSLQQNKTSLFHYSRNALR